MRRVLRSALVVAYGVAFGATPLAAAPRDLRAERQHEIELMLTFDSPQATARIRASCAMGRQPASIASMRAAGADELPDATEYCVTALTRLGRNGTLGFIRVTPSGASAFDNGFVTAYLKREAISTGLPSMASLKPVVERCLALSERDTDLCLSAGYAYGVRAAAGEIVAVR